MRTKEGVTRAGGYEGPHVSMVRAALDPGSSPG